MSVPAYNRNKYYRIIDVTQTNYVNQLNRLSKAEKRSDFILIYYSLALIIYPLSLQFYPSMLDATWITYSSIVLSIVLLVFSIINSKAAYPQRISALQIALTKTKQLKRDVGDLPNLVKRPPKCLNSSEPDHVSSCSSCQYSESCTKLESFKDQYEEIVNTTEIREDIDFYHTIVQLSKKHGIDPYTGKELDNRSHDAYERAVIKDLKGYISENNPRLQQVLAFGTHIWHFLLYIIPILNFIISILLALPKSA